MSTYRVLFAAMFLCLGPAILTESAHAADFRVDNAVYAEGQSEPQTQGVTIFYDGIVYDFLNDPAEVIVFEKAHRRFILLDITRHVQSQISTDDVRTVVNRVKQRLAGHPNPNSRWLVDPSFEESFNRENSELTLKSPSVIYQAQLQATGPSIASQYHDFSDWYTQFNLALNPSSRPPFPRMMLNEAIERHQGVAKEVHLTAIAGPKDTPIKIISRHQLVTKLDKPDIYRVSEAREYERTFQSVSFSEYRSAK
jgi:hypothetical protein